MLAHRTGERVFDRNYRRFDCPVPQPLEYFRRTRARHHRTTWHHAERGFMAKTATLPLNGDFHQKPTASTWGVAVANLGMGSKAERIMAANPSKSRDCG